jgi:hypothetical protein
MKPVLLLLISPFALICTSCGSACSKKIDCAGFNDQELLTWFPYKDNEQLVFKDSLNEEQTFTLKNTLTTQPYQSTAGVFSPPLYCDAQKVFESLERDSVKRVIFSVTLAVYSDSVRTATLNINNSSVYFNNLKDTGFMQVYIAGSYPPRSKEKFATLNLGGKSFTNVMAVVRDTSLQKTQGIYKVYYAKNAGIIAYSEYPSLKTWVKQ